MEKTISRIRNLRARRKLSLPASPNPTCSKSEQRSGSEDDLVEWSVKIRSLIPDDTVEQALKKCEGKFKYFHVRSREGVHVKFHDNN